MLKMCRRFGITFLCILLLAVMTGLLFADNLGVHYAVSTDQLTELPAGALSQKKRIDETAKTCLLLRDSTQENNGIFTKHLEQVLKQMRVGYDLVDVAGEDIPDFKGYRTAIVAFQHLDVLEESVVPLCEWVEGGGRAMLFCTPDATPVFKYLSGFLGIEEGGVAYSSITGMDLAEGFMLGSKDFNFHWGEPMATALNVRLDGEARVYARSDDESRVPLVWAADSGAGRWVVMNHGLAEKATRGLTCAAYNLLEDVSVYPVINASAFFLDDFPSPVPMGDGRYIRKDYNRDISSFYSNVWWPDMLKFCDDFGVKYTGMLIEDSTDEVDGIFPRQKDEERFNHFGALLLNHGGEIGLHGYNHLPLCFPGFDYKGKVDYKTWKTEGDAVHALREALDYTKTLFPDNRVSVYVPPSNILSAEGRKLLGKQFPEIKTISSLYLEGEIEYSQEFCIAEDGIVEFPRVISGAQLDTYMYWGAINALNMYYVNSHFIHPDDVLDEDRGAADGWQALYGNLTGYMEWLYASAPGLRNLTASDASRATQRYDVLSVERTPTEKGMHLRLDGFWDEAYLMVRCNDGPPTAVEGGSIERISGDFYLLRAASDQVDIQWKEG